MSASNYFAKKQLDHAFGGPVFVPPDPVYVALYSADPGANGDASDNEITDAAYARVAVDYNDTNWPEAEADGNYMVKTNGTLVEFPVADSDFTVMVAALVDTPSGSGNVLLRGKVSAPTGKAINGGDTPRFKPGQLNFRIPTLLP